MFVELRKIGFKTKGNNASRPIPPLTQNTRSFKTVAYSSQLNV